MVKRVKATNTSHEVEPVGYLNICKSGSNYIYVYNNGGTLTILTHTSADDIVTNGTERFTDGDFQAIQVNIAAMRVIGSTVHLVYIQTTTSPKIKYGYSVNDGESWTWDEAIPTEAGYDNIDVQTTVIDIGVVDSIPYVLLDHNGTSEIYELGVGLDYTRLWVATSTYTSAVGYIEDDIFYFPLYVGSTEYIYSFNGVAVAESETIATITAGTVDISSSILLKKGNVKYFFAYTDGIEDSDYFMKIGSGDWIGIDTGEVIDLHLSWEEDRYEPRFLHWGGNYDDVYYVSNGGYLVKIEDNTTETTKHGIGKYLYPYEIEPVAFSVNTMIIQQKRRGPRTANFIYNGNDIVRNDGFLLTEEDNTEMIIGVALIVDEMLGGQQQRVTISEPSVWDMMKTRSVTHVSVSEKVILDDFADNKCGFVYGVTIDVTGTTYTLTYNNREIHDIIEEMELSANKIYYWGVDGGVYFDDGDVTQGITLSDSIADVEKIIVRGQDYNTARVYGGMTAAGIMAYGEVSEPSVNSLNINPKTFNFPSLLTNTECVTKAQELVDSATTSYKKYFIKMIQQGFPQIGRTVKITNSEYSLTNIVSIVESWVYFPISGVCNIVSVSGLDIGSNINIGQSNIQRLSQVSSLVEGTGTVAVHSDMDSGLIKILESLETVGSTPDGAYPVTPIEGQIHWDADECMLLRWNVIADAWIEIGGGAGLVGGNSDFMPLSGGIFTGTVTHNSTVTHNGIVTNNAAVNHNANVTIASGYDITLTDAPTAEGHATTKDYVDDNVCYSPTIVNAGDFTPAVITGGGPCWQCNLSDADHYIYFGFGIKANASGTYYFKIYTSMIGGTTPKNIDLTMWAGTVRNNESNVNYNVVDGTTFDVYHNNDDVTYQTDKGPYTINNSSIVWVKLRKDVDEGVGTFVIHGMYIYKST